MTSTRRQIFSKGFSLLELLVATVIMALLVVLLAIIVSNVSQSWKRTEAQITRFQAARFAFERMTRSLSQATLNPYWDYLDSQGNRRTTNNISTFLPAKYARCSDQHFLIGPASDFTATGATWACFFQAPLGYTTNTNTSRLDNLLNAVGFFTEFNNDADAATLSLKPAFITGSRWRYRLMELRQSSEDLQVYKTTDSSWIATAMAAGREARPIAENVIALVFIAKDSAGNPLSSTANSYIYDSRSKSSTNTWNQLPAQVQVTMVVIDEDSAARLAVANGTSAPDLVSSSYFKDPAKFEQDLRDLESNLSTNSSRPDYRVFNATIRIESAKWSD